MDQQLSYNDVFLKPSKCIVDSRKECDTTIQFGPKKFVMPVCAANMKSVVNEDTCIFFAKNNWFYIMHRFGVDLLSFCKRMMEEKLFISISTGINEDSYKTLSQLIDSRFFISYITIDVANAWSEKTRKMVQWIKKNFPDSFLIVGNVATHQAICDIQEWGVDCIKIGISGGKACITKNKTGVYRPMISTILDCSHVSNVPLIADGGINEHGDIAKALSCGATMVMAGSLFAGYEQSAGNIIEIDDTMYKEYYGSASKHNKEEQKNIEGKKILIKYRGDMSRLLKELKEDLQSSISYIGGNCLDHLSQAELYIVKNSI